MNLEKRKLLIQKARMYLNVKFRDQGRKFDKNLDLSIEKNKEKFSLDCAGLVCESLNDIGLLKEGDDLIHTNYSRTPDGYTLKTHLSKIADEKDKSEMAIGDILLMSFGGHPTHIALYMGDYFNNGGEYIIHSYLPLRKVVEQRLEYTTDLNVNIKSNIINKDQIIAVFSPKDIDKE